MLLLTEFVPVPPRFRKKQEDGLLWLVEAHVQAERKKRGLPPESSEFLDDFRHRMTVGFRRFGCAPPRVLYRSHEHIDFNSFDWSAMEVFRLTDTPHGTGMKARMEAYQKGAKRAFSQWYDKALEPPAHLLHVSCTGYLSPSAAQECMEDKKWTDTTVTHLYHMGCYAAFPALRVGHGLLKTGSPGRIDVAHTEFCTLHLNPSNHEPENMVMQSLFADGMIRYSLREESDYQAAVHGPALRLLALQEMIVPESKDDMTWVLDDWGFQMTLSKNVPAKIGAALPAFQERLFQKAGMNVDEVQNCHYAIHPGGPRIIDQVQDGLRLTDVQVAHSRDVLAQYGNMSSATLPHVWRSLAESGKIPSGTTIVSFAFGPGLTISGGVFRKVGS